MRTLVSTGMSRKVKSGSGKKVLFPLWLAQTPTFWLPHVMAREIEYPSEISPSRTGFAHQRCSNPDSEGFLTYQAECAFTQESGIPGESSPGSTENPTGLRPWIGLGLENLKQLLKTKQKKCAIAKLGTDDATGLCHSWNRFLRFNQNMKLGCLITLAAGEEFRRKLPAEMAPISEKYVSGTTATCMSSQGKKLSACLRSQGSLSTCMSACLAAALMARCVEPWEIRRAVKHDSKKLKRTFRSAVTRRSDESVSFRDSRG